MGKLVCFAETCISEIESAFGIAWQAEAQGCLILECGFDLELDAVLLPLLGERYLRFLGDFAPVVGQLELDGLAERSPRAKGETVAATVELAEQAGQLLRLDAQVDAEVEALALACNALTALRRFDEAIAAGQRALLLSQEADHPLSAVVAADPLIRIPSIIEENSVGCNLCSIVCPVEDCITMERRDDGKEYLTWGDRTRAGNIPKTFDDELAGGRHHWVPGVMARAAAKS